MDNIENIEKASYSDKSKFNGQAVFLKIASPEGKYGIVFEHMNSGRNIITTLFKDSDKNLDNWIKNNSARAMRKAPTTQKGMLSSRSISDIINILNENVKKNDNLYQFAGEIEARNTQARMDMTDAERKATIPESTQDVANADAIVVFDDGTVAAYEPEAVQTQANDADSIENRTDKSKYLTDEEVRSTDRDAKSFANYVNKMIDGSLSPHTQLVVLNRLPSAYNNIPELKGKKLIINQNIYKKIIDLPNPYGKNHNVDRKRAIKLPYYVADPSYILKSTAKGHEDRFVIVTNSRGEKQGERLSVFIQPDINAVVVSGYDEIINISKEKKANRVLYDKKKELSKTNVTSKVAAIDNSNNNVTQSDKVVNSKKVKQGVKGSFTPSKNLIQLFKDADYSTLPHELAHYWLDNMWNYVKTGKASEKYMNRWNTIAGWLNIKPTQTRIYRNQQEQFARGYEAYLRTGNLPTPIIKGATTPAI